MPELLKLSQLLEEVKNLNPNAAAELCNFIWTNITTLPRNESRRYAELLNEWAAENREKFPLTYALSVYSLGLVCFHEEKYEAGLKHTGEAFQLFEFLNYEEGIAICNALYGGIYRT